MVGDTVSHFPAVGALAEDPSLAKIIVARAPSTAEHLPHLHDGHRPAGAVIETLDVPHQHTTGRQVDPGCKRRRGHDARQITSLERRFDGTTLRMGQASVVEGHPAGNAGAKRFT